MDDDVKLTAIAAAVELHRARLNEAIYTAFRAGLYVDTKVREEHVVGPNRKPLSIVTATVYLPLKGNVQ